MEVECFAMSRETTTFRLSGSLYLDDHDGLHAISATNNGRSREARELACPVTYPTNHLESWAAARSTIARIARQQTSVPRGTEESSANHWAVPSSGCNQARRQSPLSKFSSVCQLRRSLCLFLYEIALGCFFYLPVLE
jgi:hypothetical protein